MAPHILKQLLQEKFLISVKLESEKRESMTVRVKAQWATEDKMRDTLKLTEHLAKQINRQRFSTSLWRN